MSNQRQPRRSTACTSSSTQQLQQFQREFSKLQDLQQSCSNSAEQLAMREKLMSDITKKNHVLLQKLMIQWDKQHKEFQQFLKTDDTTRRINNNNTLPTPPQRNPNNLTSVMLNQMHGLFKHLITMFNQAMTKLIKDCPVQIDDEFQQQKILTDYHKILDCLIEIGKKQRIAITLNEQPKMLSVTMPPPPTFVAIQPIDESPRLPFLVEATLNGTKNICTQHSENNNNNNNNKNPFRKTPILASSKQHINKKPTKGMN